MKKISLVIASVMLASMGYADGQINIAYTPYTISTPGSYIVVHDLTTGQNLNAISINTSNVTIDLNGHTLYGAGSAVGTSGTGILDIVAAGANNVDVFNGTVRDFRFAGISLYGNNVQVSRIRAYGNGGSGIIVQGSYGGNIWDCTCEYNGDDGINLFYGGIIRNCIAAKNGGAGIQVSYASIVTGNSASQNQYYGINIFNGNTATGNIATSNTGVGILVNGNSNSVTGNTCIANGTGIESQSNNIMIENNALFSNTTGLLITSSGNFYGGDILRSNTISTSIAAGNTAGNGSAGAFSDVIVP
jgi:hypothetical protein